MTYASVLCVALLLGGGEAFTVPSRTTSRPGVAARPVRTRLASYLDNLKVGPSLDVAEPEAEVAAHAPAYKAPRRMAPAITPESLVESADLLSHQAIMENFVHHNPWEALQHMKWGDALNRVDKRLAYMSPAERMSTRVWSAAGTIPLFILVAALLRSADLVSCFSLATQSFRSTRVSAPTRRSPSWALPSLTAASPNGTRPTVTVASSTSRRRSRTSARRRGAATRVPRRTASWTGSR